MQAHQLFLRLFCQSYGTIGGMIKIACEYALPVSIGNKLPKNRLNIVYVIITSLVA
jgi:hypothetical protein